MKRRETVLMTATVLVGVTGCSALSADSSTLSIVFFNQDDSSYTVELSIFETADESRSEARQYSDSIDIGPEERTRVADVAEMDSYLVRYDLYEDNSRLTDEDHIHYYPPDDGESESLAFNIEQTGELIRRVG